MRYCELPVPLNATYSVGFHGNYTLHKLCVLSKFDNGM